MEGKGTWLFNTSENSVTVNQFIGKKKLSKYNLNIQKPSKGFTQKTESQYDYFCSCLEKRLSYREQKCLGKNKWAPK